MDLNWKKIRNTTGQYGHFREGHTFTYISKLDAIILYGGVANPRFNQIYLYSIKQNNWSIQQTIGRKPNSRSYHSALYDQQLQVYLIYGGEAEKGRSLDDFHVLSLKTWTWKKLFMMEILPARHFHSMVDMNNEERSKIIFGGISMPNGQLLNDVWILKNMPSLNSNTTQKEITTCKCQIQYTKGQLPPARKGHQSEVIGKTMFVFGGETKQKQENFTVYGLSLDNFYWKRIEVKQKIPQRISFVSLAYGNDIYLYGGMEPLTQKVSNELLRFNANNLKLVQVKVNNNPLSRYNHSATLAITHNESFRAFMVGGIQQTYRPFQIYQLCESGDGESFQRKENQISKLPNREKENSYYIEQLEMKLKKAKQEKQKLEKQIREEAEFQKEQKQQQSSKRKNSSSQQLSIQALLTMIKSEQFLSQEILKKNLCLEKLLKKMQSYIYALDQNYNNYGQDDEDIQKAKNAHIGVCIKLKQMYISIDRYYKRNLNFINNSRNEIISYNKEFQGFMQTQIDQENQE